MISIMARKVTRFESVKFFICPLYFIELNQHFYIDECRNVTPEVFPNIRNGFEEKPKHLISISAATNLNNCWNALYTFKIQGLDIILTGGDMTKLKICAKYFYRNKNSYDFLLNFHYKKSVIYNKINIHISIYILRL